MAMSGRPLRCYRAQSWTKRATEGVPASDLDGRFIFLWIAFNALYGQAKCRFDDTRSEFEDIRKFLALVSRLNPDATDRAVAEPRMRARTKELLRIKFLD